MDNQQRVRGRPFERNNPGRKRGSKNRSTLIAASLTGEQAQELVENGRRMANDGNTVLMKFFLERCLPKERLIPIELPQMHSAADGIAAMSAIVAALAAGQITPREAADLTHVVDTFVRSIEITEQDRRAGEVAPPDPLEYARSRAEG
jgi:hypothetical protein